MIESTTASGEPSFDAASVIQSQGKFDERKINVASSAETDMVVLFIGPESPKDRQDRLGRTMDSSKRIRYLEQRNSRLKQPAICSTNLEDGTTGF